jgi:hypothetical protein
VLLKKKKKDIVDRIRNRRLTSGGQKDYMKNEMRT